MQNVAEREEQRRDLRAKVAELDNQAETEVIFQEISPRRRPVTIYSTTDGEPISVPEYMVRAALSATRLDGEPRFVSRKGDAPEYKLGDIKCFLHPESPERPILAKIGLSGATCPAAHLASGHAKRLHAEHRHKHEWAALQEYLNDQKEAAALARQEKQLQATLDIARASGGQAAPVEAPSPVPEGTNPTCNSCGEVIEGKLADHQCK